jgi:hypothetical protein
MAMIVFESEITNNERRAEKVKGILSEYYPENGDEVDVVDLVADTMHFCKSNGFDFDRALEMAKGHFEAEHEENGKKRYTVHMYVPLCIRVEGVVAGSQRAAIKKVERGEPENMHFFDSLGSSLSLPIPINLDNGTNATISSVEYCDDPAAFYLVVEGRGEDFTKSTWYKSKDAERIAAMQSSYINSSDETNQN